MQLPLGIVATTAHSIAKRSSELKIRVACGATPADILLLILREQFVLVGLAIGIAMAVAIPIGQTLELPWSDRRYFRQLAIVVVPSLLGAAALFTSLIVASKTAFAKSW